MRTSLQRRAYGPRRCSHDVRAQGPTIDDLQLIIQSALCISLGLISEFYCQRATFGSDADILKIADPRRGGATAQGNMSLEDR